MNNHRLSSYKGAINTVTVSEVGYFLLADPVCKPLVRENGRILNTQTHKFKSGLGGSVHKILIQKINTTHQTILVNSLPPPPREGECAFVIGVFKNPQTKRFSEVTDSYFISET